jgi:hypothetical protein
MSESPGAGEKSVDFRLPSAEVRKPSANRPEIVRKSSNGFGRLLFWGGEGENDLHVECLLLWWRLGFPLLGCVWWGAGGGVLQQGAGAAVRGTGRPARRHHPPGAQGKGPPHRFLDLQPVCTPLSLIAELVPLFEVLAPSRGTR